MRIGCCQACACLSTCFENAQQAIAASVITLDEIRRNPEALQKTCILVQSIIQGINFCRQTNYLPDLIKILDVAHSFDFYGYCRLPRYLFHPYTAERIDENILLDQLEANFCENWRLGLPDNEGKNRDSAVRDFARGLLVELFEEMDEFDFDFQTEESFKNLMQKRFIGSLEQNPIKGFDPYVIDLSDVRVVLKKTSFLEALDDLIFISVDIACIPAFLQDWSLINLGFISDLIGRTKVFSWLSYRTLDDRIREAMCIGFLVHFSEALRSLYVEPLTPDEQTNAKWIMGAAVAEFLYNAAILQRKDPALIVFLAFAAKSLGIIQILTLPKISFFDKSET